MPAADAEMPPKPRMPAMIAMTKKMIDQVNMGTLRDIDASQPKRLFFRHGSDCEDHTRVTTLMNKEPRKMRGSITPVEEHVIASDRP